MSHGQGQYNHASIINRYCSHTLMTRFEKNQLPHTITKWLFRNTNFNCLKYCILGRKQMLVRNLPQFYTCSYSIYAPTIEWIASWASYSSIAKTTSTLIGLESRGWWEATKWKVKATSTLKRAKWHPLVPFSLPYITQSIVKFISQSCGKLQPAVCLSRGYRAIWRPPKHWWMSNKPQKQATTKAAWATFRTNTWLNC